MHDRSFIEAQTDHSPLESDVSSLIGSSVGSRWLPMAVSMLVFASRLPFVGNGFGADPDAWTVVEAARQLARTGVYVPSRMPGYPLPEFTGALLVLLGLDTPVFFNLLTALWASAGAAAAFRLARPLGPARALIFAVLVSFTPAVFVGSIGAMDYPWGFALFLAAAIACQSEKYVASGILLGLAIASRPTYALAGISLAVLALHADLSAASLRAGLRRIATIGACSLVVALLFHSPTLLSHHAELGIMERDLNPLIVAFNMSAGLLGLLGAPAVLLATSLGIRNARTGTTLLQARPVRELVIFGAVTSALYLALFLRLPDEAAYLIPALLGPYLFITATVAPITSGVVALCLSTACVLGTLSRDDAGPRAGKLRIQLAGPVIQTVKTQARIDCVARVVDELIERRLPQQTVVIGGDLTAQIVERAGAERADNVFFYLKHDSDGRLLAERPIQQPADSASFFIVDRAVKTLDPERRNPGRPLTSINTEEACPDG